MNETTLSKMKQMKFYGMHDTFKTAIETGKSDSYTIDQFVAQMIEAEWDDRREDCCRRNHGPSGTRYPSNRTYGRLNEKNQEKAPRKPGGKRRLEILVEKR